jgi:hypothetical protein
MAASEGKTTRVHWRKENHLNDPIAIAASLAQTGETSIADDDLVEIVNASTTTGFRLVTRDDVNNALGNKQAGFSAITELGIYRRGHKIGGVVRFEYYITGDDADRRRTAESAYAGVEPPFLIGKNLFDGNNKTQQQTRPAKRASQREAGESGLTPAGKATRSKLGRSMSDLLVTIEERDETIAECNETIEERDKTIAERDYEILQLKVRFVKHHHSSTIIISPTRGIFSSFSFFKVACCFFLPGAPRCCFASSRASSRASSQAAAREHRSLYK